MAVVRWARASAACVCCPRRDATAITLHVENFAHFTRGHGRVVFSGAEARRKKKNSKIVSSPPVENPARR